MDTLLVGARRVGTAFAHDQIGRTPQRIPSYVSLTRGGTAVRIVAPSGTAGSRRQDVNFAAHTAVGPYDVIKISKHIWVVSVPRGSFSERGERMGLRVFFLALGLLGEGRVHNQTKFGFRPR